MTQLSFCKKQIQGIPVGKASLFPTLRDPIRSTIDSKLSEDDGLFINYGMFSDSLPYTMLDDYDMNSKQPLEFEAAVLENEFLRAEFVLSLGGRLWSLFDKENNRELLTDNKEFIPCNLAIRNAWFAGGIEFNCGRRGHDANTCLPRFAAHVQDPELGDVLRIYDYSIDRKVPYQMDFFLPEKSRFLFSRVRIFNPSSEVLPMYWWTNMALPMTPGCRVVVPAMDTYVNKYDGGAHFITKIPMPFGEGFDQTYPENFHIVRDHFYNIPENSRKYEALFNRDGSGFIHLSTRRLQGRKLFVWGKTSGGEHWQRKLLADGVCDYLELQAGLAKSQQECLPMPPKSAWEFLEAFGGIEVSPDQVFGSWEKAVDAVTARADELLSEPEMDALLARTRNMALTPGKVVLSGNGCAALEELRSGKKLAGQLDYGQPGKEEAQWVQLLEQKNLDDSYPLSFTADPVWEEQLLAAADCWTKFYHLALIAYRKQDWALCTLYSQKALLGSRNAWTLHLMANVLLKAGEDPAFALEYLTEAALLPEADAYLIKETAKLLIIHGQNEEMLAFYDQLSEADQKRPTVRLHRAAALFHTGKAQEAMDILLADGGLELPDAREGEVVISNLFTAVAKALGKADMPMPLAVDYRTK